MFKALGFFLIIISSFFTFYYSSIVDRCTYTFIMQTIELLKHLSFHSISGLTYPRILEKADYKRLFFYNNFDFYRKDKYFDYIGNLNIIKKSEITDIDNIFSQLGRRSIADENKYITSNIAALQQKADHYKKEYNEKSRARRICGISFGLVLIIILI